MGGVALILMLLFAAFQFLHPLASHYDNIAGPAHTHLLSLTQLCLVHQLKLSYLEIYQFVQGDPSDELVLPVPARHPSVIDMLCMCSLWQSEESCKHIAYANIAETDVRSRCSNLCTRTNSL